MTPRIIAYIFVGWWSIHYYPKNISVEEVILYSLMNVTEAEPMMKVTGGQLWVLHQMNLQMRKLEVLAKLAEGN